MLRGGRTRRFGRLLLPPALALYVGYSAHQFLTLSSANLEFDFGQFYVAARALAQGHDPYGVYLACCRAGFVTDLRGYIYPPFLAMLMRPLASLTEVPAAFAWLLVLQASVLASIALGWRALRQMLSTDGACWLLVATLLFPPLLENLAYLQVGAPLVLLTVWAGAAFLERRTTPLAGVPLALGVALRVSPVLLGLAFVRRERASVRALVVAAAAGIALLGLMALAAPYLPEFLGRVLPGLGRGSAVLDNRSPTGVALRLQVLLFAGGAPVLTLVGPLVAVGVVGTTLRMTAAEASPGAHRGVVFAAWVAAVPLVSSITWTHHLATEIVALAFLAPSLPMFSRPWWLALTSYPMLYLHRLLYLVFALFGMHSDRQLGDVLLILVSATPLLGMLLLWWACLDALRRHQSTRE